MVTKSAFENIVGDKHAQTCKGKKRQKTHEMREGGCREGEREGGESKRGRELKKGRTELEKVYRKGGGFGLKIIK